MSKHDNRPKLHKNDRGYHWSARQSQWGRQLRRWRLRLDKRNVATILEDEAGVLTLKILHPCDPSHILFMRSGPGLTVGQLKGEALRWCRNFYGESFDVDKYPESAKPNPHAVRDPRAAPGASGGALAVHAVATGFEPAPHRQDFPPQHQAPTCEEVEP